ncbi:MAG: ZIP family metal transporter [Pseudomonadota bacterium]
MLDLEWTHPALIASLTAAGLSLFGISLSAFNQKLTAANSHYVTAFAAGLLVSTAILHLFPEALEASPHGAFYILAGFVFMQASGYIFARPATERDGLTRAAVTPAILGIAFHSFVDGLEYPFLFEYDVNAGVLAAAGLVMHELAEGVVIFALLKQTRIGTLLAVILAIFAAALTTPLGAILSLQYVGGADEATIAAFLGIAAGVLIYVGAAHLPRHIAGREHQVWPAWFAGSALALVVALGHDADIIPGF